MTRRRDAIHQSWTLGVPSRALSRWRRLQTRPAPACAQFTHHLEDGLFKFEIIDLRQHRPFNPNDAKPCAAGPFCTPACPPRPVPGTYRTGWRAATECVCVDAEASSAEHGGADGAGAGAGGGFGGRCMRCAGMEPDMDQIAFER